MNATTLQQLLRSVADRARAVSTRDFEGQPRLVLERDLFPALSSVLSEAIDALGSVLRHYERMNEPSAQEFDEVETAKFYLRIDGLMSAESGARRIVELAFMAQWELERKALELRAMAANDTDAWEAIARYGSARRRVLKSTIAVETALSEQEGLASGLKDLYLTELHRSLETRRAYAIFRRELRRRPANDLDGIKQALRTAGIATARLIGRDVYEDLRVTDRMRLRELQTKVLVWLRGEDGFDCDAGKKLWQDVSTYADLLLQVNHRAELREHDGALLEKIYAGLFSSPPHPESVPGATRLDLETLLGRDAELDELIENPASRAMEEWKPTLQRIIQALTVSGGDSGGAEWTEEDVEAAPVNAQLR